jgi:hypothetical protein
VARSALEEAFSLGCLSPCRKDLGAEEHQRSSVSCRRVLPVIVFPETTLYVGGHADIQLSVS